MIKIAPSDSYRYQCGTNTRGSFSIIDEGYVLMNKALFWTFKIL